MTETDCCHDCHFDYEEREAFGYLPKEAARSLLLEHQALRRAGFPPDAVRAHAMREMSYYHRFVPDRIVRRIENDHRTMLGNSEDSPSQATAIMAVIGTLGVAWLITAKLGR